MSKMTAPPESRSAFTLDEVLVKTGDDVYEMTQARAAIGAPWESRIIKRRVVAVSPSGVIATRMKGVGTFRHEEKRYDRYIPDYAGRYFSTAEACRQYHVDEARHSARLAEEQAKRAAERLAEYEAAKVYEPAPETPKS